MATLGSRGRLPGWAALLGGVALILAGCGQSAAPVGAPTTASTEPPSSAETVTNDAAGLGPGQATLTGTVDGPHGPVPGATVGIEREVNGAVLRAKVISDRGGGWEAHGVPGGSYSIRAWLPPDLAQTSTTTFFLSGQESHDAGLELTSFAAPLVQSAIAPDPPTAGNPSQVVVQVTSRQVKADGTVADQPAQGLSVQLVAQGDWQVAPPNLAITDSSGRASWTATCGAEGAQPLEADLGAGPGSSPATTFDSTTSTTPSTPDQVVPLNLPPCLAPPPPTSTTPNPSYTTTTPPTFPTTTLPSGGTFVPNPGVGG